MPLKNQGVFRTSFLGGNAPGKWRIFVYVPKHRSVNLKRQGQVASEPADEHRCFIHWRDSVMPTAWPDLTKSILPVLSPPWFQTSTTTIVRLPRQRAALAEAQEGLDIVMAQLKDAKARLTGVQKRLAELQKGFDDAVAKKQVGGFYNGRGDECRIRFLLVSTIIFGTWIFGCEVDLYKH